MFIFIVIMVLTEMTIPLPSEDILCEEALVPHPSPRFYTDNQNSIQCPHSPKEMQWFQNQMLSDNCKLLWYVARWTQSAWG